jgi:acetyl esterase/lipase
LYGFYNGFWLGRSVQFMHNLIAFLVAIFSQLPFSLSAIWNKQRRGELIWQSLFHATVDYPFKVWNITEFWWYRTVFVNLYNWFVPTKSKTVHITRQQRFRLNRLGGLMDIQDPAQKCLLSLLDDHEQRRREQYPTGQHKNHDTIRCRLIRCTRPAPTEVIDSSLVNDSIDSGKRKRSKSVNFNENINKNYPTPTIETSAYGEQDNISLLSEILKEQIKNDDNSNYDPIARFDSEDMLNKKSLKAMQLASSGDSSTESKEKGFGRLSRIWKRKKSPKLNSSIDDVASTSGIDQIDKLSPGKRKRKLGTGGHLLSIHRLFRTNKSKTSTASRSESNASFNCSNVSSVGSNVSIDLIGKKYPDIPDLVVTSHAEAQDGGISMELPGYQATQVHIEEDGWDVIKTGKEEPLNEVFDEQDLEEADLEVAQLNLNPPERARLDSSSDLFYHNLAHFLDEEKQSKVDLSVEPEEETVSAEQEHLRPDVLDGTETRLNDYAVGESRPEETVILHAHGGGFLTQSPDSHELYLRRWVSNLGNIKMLSVDYSLSVAYPIALQEMLDVYLWLASGNSEVVQLLGFRPRKIVLCGDSAGGMLCLILLLVLNDLNQMLGERTGEKILMPHAFVGFYPAFTATSLSPSKLLAKMESVLSIGPLMTVIGVYSAGIYDVNDFRRIEQSPEYRAMLIGQGGEDLLKSGLSEQTRDNPNPAWIDRIDDWSDVLRNKSVLLLPITLILRAFVRLCSLIRTGYRRLMAPKYSPWYVCDGQTYDRRTNYLIHMLNHSYGSPLVYPDFEQLKDVRLYLITSHFDVLLDDNIELARKWKGPVQLDVADHVPHGFLYYTYISKEAQQAAQLCLKRLQQACDL